LESLHFTPFLRVVLLSYTKASRTRSIATRVAVGDLACCGPRARAKCGAGASSGRELWQFGKLDRRAKVITEGTTFYRVPSDLSQISDFLAGVLQADAFDLA
jgi:hypothetical protein